MTYASMITTKGQVTIPQYFREKYALSVGDSVLFEESKDNRLILSTIPDFSLMKGVVKSKKQYSKEEARKVYLQDVLTGKV